MSHFTVLTVVTQDRLERTKDEMMEQYQPILDSGGPAALGEDDRDLGEALLEVHEDEDENLRDAITEIAVHQAIADLLAPYQENNMGDCPEEYLEFDDRTEEIHEDVQEVIEEDDYFGEKYPQYVGQTVGAMYLDRVKNDPDIRQSVIDRGFPEEELDEITEFDAVATAYHGYQPRNIDGERKYGYYHNPNSKWDWYQIGGRWCGLLKVKEEGQGFRGRSSLLGPAPPEDLCAVDIAQVGDLDISHYREQTDEKIDEFWDKYQTYMETGEDPDDHPLYGVHYDLMQMGVEWVNREEVREAQNHNKGIKNAQNKLKWLDMSDEEVEDLAFFSQGEAERVRKQAEKGDVDRNELEERADQEPVEVPEFVYGEELTKEKLQTQYRWHFEWNLYAALDEDGWHSKGEMGWFGCSSDDAEDREEWGRGFFEKFILSQDDDTYVAVVDCHV